MSNGVKTYFSSIRIPGTATWRHLFLIVLLGMVCYSNSFSAPFIFDDYDIILDSEDFYSSTNLWDILLHGGPRRVVDFTFAINYKLHGFQETGYHITNTIIHLSTAVLLYFVCVALLETLKISYFAGEDEESGVAAQNARQFMPLAVSLLFVSHPVQTQAVTYIVQRYASLAAFFYLLTMLAYIKGRTLYKVHGFNRKVAVWGLLLVTAAVLAFYTKPSTYSLPLMIIMLEFGLYNGRMLKRIMLIFGIGAVLLFSFTLLPTLINGSITDFISYLDYKSSEDYYTERMDYFLTQLTVIATYLRLLILPIRQRLDYDYPLFDSLLDIEVSASFLLHIILLSASVSLYLRSRYKQDVSTCQNGNLYRLIAIGIAWFYIALSVTSSFIPITDVIMEHRVYLPSAGFFIAIAATFQLLGRKFKGILRYQWLGVAAICLLLSITTLKRNHVWNDELRFWQNEAKLSPESGRVLTNLGSEYLDRGNNEKALRLFVDAINLEPNVSGAWIMLNDAVERLGLYQGRYAVHDQYLTEGDDIDYRYYTAFYCNEFNTMGLATEFIGKPEEAIKWYKKSLALNPKFDLALFNIGLLSARLGIAGNAELAIAKLMAVNPQLAAKLKQAIPADNQSK